MKDDLASALICQVSVDESRITSHDSSVTIDQSRITSHSF